MYHKIRMRLYYFVVVAMSLSIASFSAAEQPASEQQTTPHSFTVVLLPDTQLYSLRHPETYSVQTRWIKSRVKDDNIKFVIHLGDIVHNNTEEEWRAADRAHRLLDGVVSYSMVPGNHDFATADGRLTRDASRYNKYFPPSRYEKDAWYGGHMGEANDNNYCFFEDAGLKFMVVSLEFSPTDEALDWAASVIAKHKRRRVIVATHCYLRPDGRDTKGAQGYRLEGNSGEEIWQKLIRKHENIFLVVCGHITDVAKQTSVNDAGGQVHEILTDYQHLPGGGNGWLRTLRFVPRENKIYVKAYTPLLDRTNEEPRHTYTLDYDMSGAKLKKAG